MRNPIPGRALFCFLTRSSAILAFALPIAGSAIAADTGLPTADALAMGGAVIADAHAGSALLVSPAALALEPRYDLYFGARLGGADDWLIQTEARDSRTGPLALGVAYTRRMANPPPDIDDLPGWVVAGEDLENPLTENTIALGLATSLWQRQLCVGLSAARYARDTALTDPDASYNLGFGLSSHPLAALDLAVSASDLLSLARGGDPDHPTTLHAGIGGHLDELARAVASVSANLDPSADGLPLSWAVGAEATLADQALPLRLGFNHDAALATNFLSAGLGLQAPAASLDYAFRYDIGPDGGASAITGTRAWHALTLRVVLPEDDSE